MSRFLMSVLLVTLQAAVATAAPCDTRLPLRDGRLRYRDLNAALCSNLGLPSCPAGGEIELGTEAGSDFLLAVNAVLWNGCWLEVANPSAAVLHFDSAKVP